MAKSLAEHNNDVIARRSDDPPDEEYEEPVERLRKIPGKVTEIDLKIISQAISLKQATRAFLPMAMTDGEAIALICIEWLKSESARLSAKGGGGG